MQLPEIFDKDEGDKVRLTAKLTNKEKLWINFDPEYKSFFLHPTNKTSTGLTRVQVFLDDSKVKKEYYFSFWVLEDGSTGGE